MIRSAAVLLAAGGTALLASACSSKPAAAPAAAMSSNRQCFLASQVNGYSPISDEAVDVQVGANRYFRLDLFGFCPNVDWSRRVALRTTGGGSWICQGLDAEIIVPEPGLGPQRCLVRSVRQISKEQWLSDRREK